MGSLRIPDLKAHGIGNRGDESRGGLELPVHLSIESGGVLLNLDTGVFGDPPYSRFGRCLGLVQSLYRPRKVSVDGRVDDSPDGVERLLQANRFGNECDHHFRGNRIDALDHFIFCTVEAVSQFDTSLASRFFDAAEIIELHHDQKVDARSGTALATANEMVAARGKPFERNVPEKETLAATRAAEVGGISIHSVRLPGLVAHQEVIFGGLGQTLTIRHDTTGRASFIPGVLLATREVMQRKELVRGLEALVGLA